MRRLTRSEHGATAVLVGILLVPLIGGSAIAVDVGMMYAERAQQQNGADGAALAIASSCAKDEGACTGLAQGIADDYVGQNASFSSPNASPTVDVGANMVTVTTDNSVNHPLAAVIVGRDSSTVGSVSSAEWGSPYSGTTLALAIDNCEFLEAPPSVGELILLRYDQVAQNGDQCSDAKGGFGWLESTDCSAHIEIGDDLEVLLDGTTGNAAQKSGCTTTRLDALVGTTVLVPIYDAIVGVGGATQYVLKAFAALELTDYRTEGSHKIDQEPKCNGNCRGIQGRFVEWVDIGSDWELGGPDYGLGVVRLLITDEQFNDLVN